MLLLLLLCLWHWGARHYGHFPRRRNDSVNAGGLLLDNRGRPVLLVEHGLLLNHRRRGLLLLYHGQGHIVQEWPTTVTADFDPVYGHGRCQRRSSRRVFWRIGEADDGRCRRSGDAGGCTADLGKMVF